MPNFLDQLRPASFKGFEFDTPSDSVVQGRRLQAHKYPGKDEPYHEDMGLDIRSFSIEAIIFGNDFIEKSNSFEEILLQKDAGTLIHPHYGEMEVIARSITRTHSSSTSGNVSFSITFEKYGAQLYPNQQIDTALELFNTSEQSYLAIANDFIDNFNIKGMPSFVALDALIRVTNFTGNLDVFLKNSKDIEFIISDLPLLPNKVIGVFKQISDLAKPISQAVISLNNNIIAISKDPLSQIDLIIKTLDTSLDDNSLALTNNQSTRIKNANSLDLLFKSSAIASAISTARFAKYESQAQATQYKKLFTDNINKLSNRLADNGWDNAWRGINNMNAAITRDIDERIGRLPYTLKIKPVNLRSSLALSNHLYGDDISSIINQAQDIVTRNNISHSGFVPARKLEVLINAT